MASRLSCPTQLNPQREGEVCSCSGDFLTLLVISSVTLTKLFHHPEAHSGDSIWERGLILVGLG